MTSGSPTARTSTCPWLRWRPARPSSRPGSARSSSARPDGWLSPLDEPRSRATLAVVGTITDRRRSVSQAGPAIPPERILGTADIGRRFRRHAAAGQARSPGLTGPSRGRVSTTDTVRPGSPAGVECWAALHRPSGRARDGSVRTSRRSSACRGRSRGRLYAGLRRATATSGTPWRPASAGPTRSPTPSCSMGLDPAFIEDLSSDRSSRAPTRRRRRAG